MALTLSPVADARVEFTQAGYAALVKALLARDYRFLSFPQSVQALAQAERFVLMRHDIDFDLKAALEMAETEAELGVQSTYFFMLRTEHYSVFTKAGSARVGRILDLGHHLGLHFDCASYNADTTVAGFAEACEREAEILGKWFSRSVDIVSYHRPAPLVLTGDSGLSAPRLHTYMAQFTKHMHYCSDSRGEWKHGIPTELEQFKNGRPLHILVHPVWWGQAAADPKPRLEALLNVKLRGLRESFAENCTVFRA